MKSMRIRLPRSRQKSNFRLFVAEGEATPPDRWSHSLRAALRDFERLDDRWKPHAWIIEYHEEPTFGGIPLARNVVHLRAGRPADDSDDGAT